MPVAAVNDSESAGTTVTTAARTRWVARIDSLGVELDRLDSAVQSLEVSTTADGTAKARDRFLAARLAFKRVEALSAYYEPSTTRAMNGPALPRVDDEEGPEAVFLPEGLQVVEEMLYGDVDAAAARDALGEIRNVRNLVTRLRTAAARQVITEDRLWDAAKVEVARVVSLGITGFDSPVALHSLPEARAALQGVLEMLTPFADSSVRWQGLERAFGVADSVLAAEADFDRFDRLDFIVTAANPLSRALVDTRSSLGFSVPQERRAFRVEAVTLFDSGAFDAQAFAPPGAEAPTAAQVDLGKRLFSDKRLSGDDGMSCATCHDASRAYTDARPRSMARSRHVTMRNTPTLINSGLQVGSFYDLRTTYLEDQVTAVVSNAEEMHGSVDRTAERLRSDATYRAQFAGAYATSGGSAVDSAVSGRNIRLAVAAYLRSLQGLHSRADRALRGEPGVLDPEERLGLNLFMGKAKCATCHFAPLFNGTVPPTYQESEVEVLGVPATAAVRGARIDTDSGRFRVTRAAPHLYAFKTPTVRNVELTAPYMHNGVYRTLEEVVDFYNRGGGAGIGISLPNQTLPADSLGLSRAEQRALVRFMRALTDTSGASAPSRALPQSRSR
ncbi:MAG TPA: cytochrome c peroxidase [Gemmatimonas sp.]|nr:cytochrome c peroxidase [Gemmatimonas sp.]